MKRTSFPSRAIHSAPRLVLGIAATAACFALSLSAVRRAAASARPVYGGTLRVQMREHLTALDPRVWPTDPAEQAAAQRLMPLVFDRLVQFDDRGEPQPALAVSWQHDAQSLNWQFRLRDGVKFSDGTALTPDNAAASLQQTLGKDFQVRALPGTVQIQAARSAPDLLVELAAGPHFIFLAPLDNSLTGTGAFRVLTWPAAGATPVVSLGANDECWAGRPFVDKIELTMGVDPQQQANAVSFGEADVVELSASQVRREQQRGVRTVSSEPATLLALEFDTSRPAANDQNLRAAVSLAIDRAAIANVVLQRQAAVAAGFLPQWLSGYESLLRAAPDLARAKELLSAQAPGEVPRSTSLALVYDSSDADARAVAERVAFNLREVGLAVQVFSQASAAGRASDLRLVRIPLRAPDPAVTLAALLTGFGESVPADLAPSESRFAAERAAIGSFRVIPLVHETESYGLGPHVRNWMTPRWGGWRLEEVSLSAAEPAAGAARNR